MRKLALAIMMGITSTSALAADWHLVSTSTAGDRNYLDMSSIDDG